MYGIIDYDTKWVVCKWHCHRSNNDSYITDYKQICYVISKYENYVSKTNWYTGVVVYKENLLTISEEQYNLITTECEKIMKAKSLLTTTLNTLVEKLPKPKIDNKITDVNFEND